MENTPIAAASVPQAEAKAPLKLNYKRTFVIGFAFFGILLLWQIYNLTCPTYLTELFTKLFYPGVDLEALKESDFAAYTSDILHVQYIVGIIMALDNIAALIMLPIFGRLSDKTKSPLGKRMPFILIGTLIAAIAVPFIPLSFHLGSLPGLIASMAVVIFFMMMYRSPAVALMPDMTPKPLRAKANGVINIAGYLGGGIGTVMLLITPFQLTTYLNGDGALWRLEVPYLVVSVMMIVSVLVLFVKIKENKIEQEIEPEMKRGEMEAEIVDKLTNVADEAPMSKANKRMLLFILAAEVLWFMSFNAVETYIGNYVIYFLKCQSGSTSLLGIIAGACSVVGFLTAGPISERIGRKWTIFIGLAICCVSYFAMIFVHESAGTVTVGGAIYHTLPWLFYPLWIMNGYGGALIHTCSFPMVVELCTKKKVGRFTGYYYAASMAAQSLTPILVGLLFLGAQEWVVLPIYATAMMAASLIVFSFVKNVKIQKVQTQKGLEALGGDD